LHILILGAAGMVGRKLTERLLRDGHLGKREITRMTLQDVVAPATPAKAGFPVDTVTCDFAVPGVAEKLVADRPDVIFHLAAIVSGEAELDFDKGYRINLDGTRMLLDAVRLAGGGYKPRIVFTSSIAVFGAPFPEAIGDEFFHTPLLSYGTQKAIGELLLADYSRRGLRILFQHPARTAGRQGSGAAGLRGGPALACLAALGGRFPGPCRDYG
jgi:D-erythronate 2-dehydrogenase